MITPLIRSQLAKNRDLILGETQRMNGFMGLLMKQRNTGIPLMESEKALLKTYLKRMAIYVPVLFLFLMPCGLILLPILAEALDRRKNRRHDAEKTHP